jgi:hypothetical protein
MGASIRVSFGMASTIFAGLYSTWSHNLLSFAMPYSFCPVLRPLLCLPEHETLSDELLNQQLFAADAQPVLVDSELGRPVLPMLHFYVVVLDFAPLVDECAL